jgi:trans-aconitate methyltransferase
VYETLVSRCGLRQDTAVFEIGAGTGTATRRLLDLGANPLVAIEPDPRLAEFLRAKSPDQALRVMTSTFEDAVLDQGTFDLGLSATAFHWLEETSALAKIATLLRPGAWWVAVWNEFGDYSLPDPFHDATHELLRAPIGPSAGERSIPYALDTEERMAALNRGGVFDLVEHKTSQWPLVLDADETVALYATYSNINARPDRGAVLAEVGRIAREDFENRVVRNMITSLYIARRAG